MLCIKKPVRFLRLSRSRVRALRSAEANKVGKKCRQNHRTTARAPHPKAQPPHQSDYRCDLDRGQQDQKPVESGIEVRLARTQDVE